MALGISKADELLRAKAGTPAIPQGPWENELTLFVTSDYSDRDFFSLVLKAVLFGALVFLANNRYLEEKGVWWSNTFGKLLF